MAKVDKRTISDNLDVEVTHVDNGYTVACTNKNTTAPLVIRVNFDASVNLKATAINGAKMITATVAELTVQPGTTVTGVSLAAVNPAEAYSYKYTCATQLKKVAAAAAPSSTTTTTSTTTTSTTTTNTASAPAPAATTTKAAAPTTTTTTTTAAPAAAVGAGIKAPVPAGVEETERKSLADGLEILIHSINNGYNLQIDNSNGDSAYTVILDLEASENLSITAEGAATLEGKKITVLVPQKAVVDVVNMPVDNWDLGSCELRYKAAIRKQ